MERISLRTNGLVQAYRIVESVVIRNDQGSVYSIEIGETLLDNQQSSFGGKVTLEAKTAQIVGFCTADSVQGIVDQAQDLIASAAIQSPEIMSSQQRQKPNLRASA